MNFVLVFGKIKTYHKMSTYSSTNTSVIDLVAVKLATCKTAEEKIEFLTKEIGILTEKNRSLVRECDFLIDKEKSLEEKYRELECKNSSSKMVHDFFKEHIATKKTLEHQKSKACKGEMSDISTNDIPVKVRFDSSEKILDIDLSKLFTVSDVDGVEIILEENAFLISRAKNSAKQKNFTIEKKPISHHENSDKEIKEKTNKEKYEELQNRCKGNISLNFAEFFRNTENITLTDMEFFQDSGLDINEAQSYYYPDEERYSNALQYACENRLYDKMEISLRAGADPNFLIGKKSGCCPCVSPIDAVIYGNRNSCEASEFDEMEKQIELLIRYGALYEISEESANVWRKITGKKDTESGKFIQRFIEDSEIRNKNNT
jgi:hypothetical protein